MSEYLTAVAEFHAAADLPIEHSLIELRPVEWDAASDASTPQETLRKLRRKLITEEFGEYVEAEEADDMTEVADALADMIYVIIGTALSYGIPIDAVFNEVHRSNMTKCVNGKVQRRADGKILKPDTFEPPNISAILERA